MLHQEDKLIICPYNPAHLIRPQRMQTHLVKCRKSNVLMEYVYCPLDATHHLPKQELALHLQTCSKRAIVESVIYKRSNVESVNPQLSAEAVNKLLPECEESWEDDSTPTYNPMEHSASQNVIRILKGAQPAERKAFQQQERLRLLEIQERKKKEGPLQVVSVDRTAVTSEASGSVRLPMKPSKAVLCAQKQSQMR